MLRSNVLKRAWYVTDAKNKILGRLSTAIARYLMGKHKVEYAPYKDVGDYVVVLNAKEVLISGNKRFDKIYYRHTGYIGGIKQTTFKDMINKNPERVIEIAVKGMLPKGVRGRMMYRRLKVCSGNSHMYCAQTPKLIDL